MSEEETNLLSYRISSVEEKQLHSYDSLVKINEKLDRILDLQKDSHMTITLEAERRLHLDSRVKLLETEGKDFSSKLVGLQISLAEKVGPGAIAGGGVAIVVGVLQYLVSS